MSAVGTDWPDTAVTDRRYSGKQKFILKKVGAGLNNQETKEQSRTIFVAWLLCCLSTPGWPSAGGAAYL